MAITKNKKSHTTADLGFAVKSWAADALRNTMDAAEHKHVDFDLSPASYTPRTPGESSRGPYDEQPTRR